MVATSAAERQLSHREVWASKPVLREVYGHLYRRIAAECRPGLTIEVGGGSGNFKQFAPDVLSFDIVHEPWLDFVADAQAMPLRSSSVTNIIMLDVLHHIEYPLRFLKEAARALQPGGRVIFVEPAITPLSGIVYRALHEEPVDMTADPLAEGIPDPRKDPYVGNQAIPTLLLDRHLAARLKRWSPRWIEVFEVHKPVRLPAVRRLQAMVLDHCRRGSCVVAVEDRVEEVLGPGCGIPFDGGI